jgi:hypothetical protein
MIHVSATQLPLAYIGPGAGFAFLGSLLTLLLSLAASLVSLLLWPFRMLWAALRKIIMGRGRAGKAGVSPVKKLIFLGLDGLDPELTERLMAEGKLPNLTRLREQGSYRRLRTAVPVSSQVVWSRFAKGVNRAEVPSAEPFWKILGRNAVDSTILRVPGTPPDTFNGRVLSIAAVQGGFSLFTKRMVTKRSMNTGFEGGRRYPLIEADGVLAGELAGPGDSILFRVRDPEGNAILEIEGESHALKPHQYTPWIRLRFGASHCIIRFLVTKTGQDFSLYATPVQIDPEKPAIPISQPAYYAAYLAKLLGSYSTSGMAEDMLALNQGAIDEEDFLAQAKLVQSEREAMFFSALDHQPGGVLACVFDTPGEIDRIVGRTLDRADKQTVVFILSNQGVLFSNRKLDAADPGIEDMAPTALRLFGIQPPEWMEGKSVIRFA